MLLKVIYYSVVTLSMDKQIAEKRKEAKGKGKRKDIPIRMQSSKQGEIRKPSSVITAKI